MSIDSNAQQVKYYRWNIMTADVESRYFVEAAAKLLDVLESFSSQDEELSITDVARRTNLTYSSAFRLLYTLEKRGYIMRTRGKKRYNLAPARRRFRIGYAGLQGTRFQREVSWSIAAAASKMEVVLVSRTNDEYNASKAIANADRLLAEKIDFLIEYQFNQTASQVIAVKCHEAGVPCVSINFAQSGAYYYGGNNYATGVMAAEFMAQFARVHWKGRLKKCIVLTTKGLPSTQETRIAGLRDSLRKGLHMRNCDLVISPPAMDAREGYSVTSQLLRHLGTRMQRLGIIAITDSLGIGAERSIREAGLEDQAVIVGNGGARDARRLIRARSAFRASVAFFPDLYGEQILSIALQVLRGAKVPLATYTNHVVLTSDNLPEYYPTEAELRV